MRCRVWVAVAAVVAIAACTSQEIVYVQADGGATVASSSAASGGSGGATSASSGGIGGQGGSGGTMGLGGSGGQGAGAGEAVGTGGVGAGGSAASVGGSSGTGGAPTVLVKCRTWSEDQVYTCCDVGDCGPSPYYYFIQYYQGQATYQCHGGGMQMNEPTPCAIGDTCYVDKGSGTSFPGTCE
jgi:hypothetical protein